MAPQCRFTCSVARKSADGTVTHFCRGHCGTPAPTWGMRGRRSNAAGHAASTRMRYARRRRELTPARPAPREEELVISVQLCRPVPQHPPRLLSFHCCCCRTRLCVSQLAVCVCVCVCTSASAPHLPVSASPLRRGSVAPQSSTPGLTRDWLCSGAGDTRHGGHANDRAARCQITTKYGRRGARELLWVLRLHALQCLLRCVLCLALGPPPD